MRRIIALGIAVALAAVGIAAPVVSAQEPVVSAQEQDRDIPGMRPPVAQRDCAFTFRSFNSTAYVVDPDLQVTISNGLVPRNVILQLSSEAVVNAAGQRLKLRYSFDGGAFIVVGAEFFAENTVFATRTQIGVQLLGAGSHMIRPGYAVGAAGQVGSVFFRCLTVEGRTQ